MISEMIKSKIPSSYVAKRQLNNNEIIAYVLPFDKTREFSNIFRVLENDFNDIEFKVVLSNLEEAFINFANIHNQKYENGKEEVEE